MNNNNKNDFMFCFNEIVIVINQKNPVIHNKKGMVLGMSTDNDGVNGYAVFIFDLKLCYDVLEDFLYKVDGLGDP